MVEGIDHLKELLGEDCWEEPDPTDESEYHSGHEQTEVLTNTIPQAQESNIEHVSDSDLSNAGCGKPDWNPAPDDDENSGKEDTNVELTTAQLQALELRSKNRFKNFNLSPGELAKETLQYCLWDSLMQYPFQFIGNKNRERAKPFFTKNRLFEGRSWDFFYMYNPGNMNEPPFLLVPTYQFQNLLEEINIRLGTELRIPDSTHSAKFSMTFNAREIPRPRFLGRACYPVMLKTMKDRVPPAEDEDKNKTDIITEKLRLLTLECSSNKNADKKAKSQRKRKRQHKSWGRSVKRIQRYLGLRAKTPASPGSVVPVPREINPLSPVSSEPEGMVRFVAIDVEANEVNQRTITEIGIAILDTRDMAGVPPGENGEHWVARMTSWHLRIKEHVGIVNHRYVQGCPDKFNFGTSTVVPMKEINKKIGTIIGSCETEAPQPTQEQRKIVLVGHDIQADIDYLKTLDYHVDLQENMIDVVDTQNCHRHLRQLHNSRSLDVLLGDMGINGHNLHNAGNDAVYTLQAMLALALRARHQSIVKAREKALIQAGRTPSDDKQNEGWSTGGELSDGGPPVKPGDPDPVREQEPRYKWAPTEIKPKPPVDYSKVQW